MCRPSTARCRTVGGSFLVGCDGHKSTVRANAGITAQQIETRHRFAMLDLASHDRFGHKAALVFHPEGTVESFPMPHGLRRWILQLYDQRQDVRHMPIAQLCAHVNRLANTNLSSEDCCDRNGFQLRTMKVGQYHAGRVVLCGDSAHVISPLGGQGLNLGLADAYELSRVLGQAAGARSAGYARLFRGYERRRRRAYRQTNRWANSYTWFGTRSGKLWSRCRDAFCREILFRRPMVAALPAHFAMMYARRHVPLQSGGF